LSLARAYHFLFVRRIEALSLQSFLLSLQSLKLGLNVWIDKVGDVLAIVELGDTVVFP
jgi:hypothetical protein